MIRPFRYLIFCLLIVSVARKSYSTDNTVTDRDGNVYRTERVVGHEFIAENLRTTRFRNGDPVMLASNERQWQQYLNEHKPAFRYYQYDKKYKSAGLLYNHYALTDPRSIAPEGYHVMLTFDRKYLEMNRRLMNYLRGLPKYCKVATDSFPANYSFNYYYAFEHQYEHTQHSNQGYLARCIRNEHQENSHGPISKVRIGQQEWMSHNLNAFSFNNGDAVYRAMTPYDWQYADMYGIPAATYADFNLKPNPHGLLYNAYAISDPRGLCPAGWHVPRTDEWKTLIDIAGEDHSAGIHLKSDEINAWSDKTSQITNRFGFNAAGNGSIERHHLSDLYKHQEFYAYRKCGTHGTWWSSSAKEKRFYVVELSTFDTNIKMESRDAGNGYSVRCIKELIRDLNEEAKKNSPSDEYPSVKVGSLTWMTENLSTEKFRNGEKVKYAGSLEEWVALSDAGQAAWCYFDFDQANENSERFYNFYAVTDARGLAPQGWKIPGFKEWKMLSDALTVMTTNERKKMMEQLVKSLPGYLSEKEIFLEPGRYAGWWTSDKTTENGVNVFININTMDNMNSGNSITDPFFQKALYPFYCGFSVRCVKEQ